VDANGTLLGPEPSFAPGSFRGVGRFTWRVSSHLSTRYSESNPSPAGRRSAAGIPQREGTSDEVASATTETAQNVSTFVASTENADNNTGRPILRWFCLTNLCRTILWNMSRERASKSKPVNCRPLGDWTERLQEWERILMPEEHIAKFGKGYGGSMAKGRSAGRLWERW